MKAKHGLVKINFDVDGLKKIIQQIKIANKADKVRLIQDLMAMDGYIKHHEDKTTKRVVLATYEEFEYAHENSMSIKLTGEDYDVILMPDAYFKRHEKKFDVLLLRGHIFLELLAGFPL